MLGTSTRLRTSQRLGKSTLSPILGFIVYITSIERSKAASPVVSMALTVSNGYLIDRHPTNPLRGRNDRLPKRYTTGFRKARYSSMVG